MPSPPNTKANSKNRSIAVIGARSIAVIGGGAWGGALASSLATVGHKVAVLVRAEATADSLLKGQLPRLNNAPITPPTLATTDSRTALTGAEIVLIAVPVAASEAALDVITQHAPKNAIIGFTAKGLYGGDAGKEWLLLPELAARHAKQKPVMLCGPSFAVEVVAGKPCCLVSASTDANAAASIAELFAPTAIRVYVSNDALGVAVAASVKNVIAIAAGMLDALQLGSNSRAALITRGLAEATRLALALGGRMETMFGLAGAGDLILTATDTKSRNYSYGFALGRGETPAAVLAEGALTAAGLIQRAKQARVELPIIAAVDRVVNQQSSIADEIKALLARPAESEWKGG